MKKTSYHYPWHSLGVAALLGCSVIITGCEDRGDSAATKQDSKPKLSETATTFVEKSETPHEIDSATEFSAAMASFAGGKRPDVRKTTEGVEIVRVEKAPAITKPGEQPKASAKPLEKDWDGTVLIPSGTQLSHAHTTDVKLARIEAHPLKSGYLRVWVRVGNLTDQNLDTRVACNFKSASNEVLKTAFVPVTIPKGEAVDAYFMSPMPNVVSYTILVR